MPMKLLALLLAVAVPVLAAAPASAADIATLGCVDQQLPATLRASLAADVQRQMGDGTFTFDPALNPPLVAVLRGCQRTYGWSEVATQAAGVYLRASIGLPLVITAMRGLGVDTDKVMAIYRDLPQSIREKRLDQATMRQLMDAVVDTGMIKDVDQAKLLGRMIAYANLIEMSRHDFAAG